MTRNEYAANEALAATATRKTAAWAVPAKRTNRKPVRKSFFARLLGL